ncbi:hypothetical protein KEJ19_07965 [Candidatus Bathyarchaeota archaeon]|nr:hypothetical protein [Candidatus Bathyarchaeota archaeon]
MVKGKAYGYKPLLSILVALKLSFLLLMIVAFPSLFPFPSTFNIHFQTLAIQKACAFSIPKAELTVYRDGIVHVKLILYANETEASVSIPLLDTSITNVLALDENKEPLDYDVNATSESLTIYSFGATIITLEYDTDALTSKSAGLWTLQLKAPFTLKVLLPENSTILYISSTPSSIGIEGERISLTLFPGDWEISYEVAPLKPKPPTPPPREPTLFDILLQYGVLIATVAAFALFGFVFTITVLRRRRLRELRSEEAEVLKFIRGRGGRVFEAELRGRFPEIPRTSMWRLIRRLEKRGIVSVKKVGMQNVIELK